jgi:flavin reductase (DIM6/NTAB) family NADH-FMN oxidoreductase RutF/GAF domain-containing protein
MTADPGEFRRTMGLFATGVTVITAREGERIHGMTANAVTSVSLDPLLVLVCVDNRARMRELLPHAGRFAINVLAEHQHALSLHFSGKPSTLDTVTFSEIDGVPALPEGLATLVCTLDRIVESGDHIVAFGRVDALARGEGGARPLVFYAGEYQRLSLSARLRRLEREGRIRDEALARIARAVAASLDVDEVFGTFACELARLIPHDATSVTLLGEDGRLERVALATTKPIEPRAGERQPLHETVAGLVVYDGQTVWSGDMAVVERFRGENDRRWIAEGFRSFIAAPLRAKGRLIGSLNILSRAPARYAERDVRLAEQVADQIAIFLDNMRLHARLSRLEPAQTAAQHDRAARGRLAAQLAAIAEIAETALRSPQDSAGTWGQLEQIRGLAGEALRENRQGVANGEGLLRASVMTSATEDRVQTL